MLNINPTMRPFVAAIAPPAPVDPLQAARAQAWREVNQSEAAYPQVLRALRDQQQHFQNTGVLS